MVINGEVESYEQTVNYLKEEIRSPESEVEDLEDDRDELLIRIRDLKEELEQLENKLGG
jgi:predicted  nucleic acid-binding Zn-ribbon protein